MASFNELRRRGVLPLAGVAVAAYYLLVFMPLARRSANLDEPLQKGWKRLSASLEQTNATTLDFSQITNQLNETRAELALLEEAKKKAATRLDLVPELRTRMAAPFPSEPWPRKLSADSRRQPWPSRIRLRSRNAPAP